jgi:hypothetical protein
MMLAPSLLSRPQANKHRRIEDVEIDLGSMQMMLIETFLDRHPAPPPQAIT